MIPERKFHRLRDRKIAQSAKGNTDPRQATVIALSHEFGSDLGDPRPPRAVPSGHLQ